MSTDDPSDDLATTLAKWEAFERSSPAAAARYLQARPELAAKVAEARRAVLDNAGAPTMPVEAQAVEVQPVEVPAFTALSTASAVLDDGDDTPLPQRLEAVASVSVLHHRQVPGTAMVAHHLVAAATGLYVVHAWSDEAVVEKRDLGTPVQTDHRLLLDGKDRTDLVESVTAVATAVRNALAGSRGAAATVWPVVCFTRATWPPLFRRPLLVRTATVLWPAALEVKLRETGGIDSAARHHIIQTLAERHPPAG